MGRRILTFWFLQETHSTKSIIKAEFCYDTKIQQISWDLGAQFQADTSKGSA